MKRCLPAIFASLLCVAPASGKDSSVTYPAARRVDQVDDYHGEKVADPYRWLEEDARNSREVADWIEAQNKVAHKFLDAIPEREDFRRRLTELWNYERYSPPWKVAGRYFFTKNDGLQNQSVLYWSEHYDDEGRKLIDPNEWSKEGTIALGQTEVSDDGKLLAYARQEAGSDWSTIYVIEVDTGRVLADELKWSRHGNIVWNAAGDGFFYARYPEPPADEKYQAPSLNQMIYFHKLGTKQDEDRLVYRRPERAGVELLAEPHRRRPLSGSFHRPQHRPAEPGARSPRATRRLRRRGRRRRRQRHGLDDAYRRLQKRIRFHRQRGFDAVFSH